MTVTDYGVLQLASFIKGNAIVAPTYMCFGTGSVATDVTKNYLNREVESAIITKAWVGNEVQFVSTLSTLQANGSSIGEIGIGIGSPCGSTLWARDLSAIGDKDNTYSVTIYTNWRVERS